METLTLQYLNEDDKAYGLAGMAVSLGALDALDRVARVSIDNDGPMVIFSNEYYFTGSPSVSPKSAWNELLHNYYITTSMILSNVMSRALVRMHTDVPSQLLESLREAIAEEGRETCSLEDDEIENLYSRSYSAMRRLFNNPRLHPAIDDLARIISRRRELSGTEILDELRVMQIV